MINENTEENIRKIVENLRKVKKESNLDFNFVVKSCSEKWKTSETYTRSYINGEILDRCRWYYSLGERHGYHANSRIKLVKRTLDYLDSIACPNSERDTLVMMINNIYDGLNESISERNAQSLDSMEGLGEFKW